jgi:hypothetical protein
MTGGRKYYPLASGNIAPATTVTLASGSRLISVKGENTTSPTYDFVVQMYFWQVSGSVAQVSRKYCGYRNGTTVNLEVDWPLPATTSATPANLGAYQINLTSGTNVSMIFYGSTGAVDTA